MALQFWSGDQKQAHQLSKLIADLEPEFNPRATFLLVHAFDCPPPSREWINTLSAKFKTIVLKSETKWVGFPDGCAAMWLDTLDWAKSSLRTGKTTARCLLTFEADCCPLVTDWIDRLVAVFDRENPVAVMGDHHAFTAPGFPRGFGHINGNMVVSLKSLEVLDKIASYRLRHRKKDPWDVVIYPELFVLGSKSIPEIQSDYRVKNLAPSYLRRLVEAGVVLLHGCKDSSARDWVSGTRVEAAPFVPKNTQLGINYFEEAQPSVFEQGFEGGIVTFEGVERKNRVNGSSVGFQGKNYLAFRLNQGFEPPEIWLASLEKPDKAKILGKITGLATWEDETWVNGHADPRLLLIRGKPHVAYSHFKLVGEKVVLCNQRLAELSPDLLSVVRDIPLPFFNNFPKDGYFEKNWGFFEDRGELMAVHEVFPQHVIVSVDSGKVRRSTPFGGAGKWVENYGQPRGSTPPVRVKEGWLSLFHSHTVGAMPSRRYYVGAYLFSSRESNFQPNYFSKRPLLVGSLRDGFAWRPEDEDFNPAVIFPGSLELSPDGGIFTISGLNEHSLAWHHLSKAELSLSFKSK